MALYTIILLLEVSNHKSPSSNEDEGAEDATLYLLLKSLMSSDNVLISDSLPNNLFCFIYELLSKKEKRDKTEKRIKNDIETHKYLKAFYIDKKMYKGKRLFTSVVGHKKKEYENCVLEVEEEPEC